MDKSDQSQRHGIKARDKQQMGMWQAFCFWELKPAPSWHKHNVDWVPTLQLGKKNYRPKLDHDANVARAERAKKRQQLVVERQECKAAEKRQKLVESSLPAAQIDFGQPSASTEGERN